MIQEEWKGYIEDVLNSKKSYVDTRKTVIINDIPLVEKTVRTEDQVVTWHEDREGEMVDVNRTFK